MKAKELRKKILTSLKIISHQRNKIVPAAYILTSICTTAFAQSDNLDALQKQFNVYREDALQEKIFVHTDKTFYVTGEIIWFKLYYVDGSFHKPIDLSKLAYVEVIGKDQKPVLQSKIDLKKGLGGSGSFMIPISLNSGYYILRAYTNWMKNFGPDFFFEKPITIVNTLKKPNWQNIPDNGYQVQFFPEGGDLVYGLTSKVAFQVLDQNGKGSQCIGVIVNQDNDTITTFQSFKFGIGHFAFTPVEGNSYKAIVNIFPGRTISQVLPLIYKQGYVMNVTSLNNEQIQVSLNTNIKDGIGPVYLFAHTRQIIKAAEMKELVRGKATFIIEKKILGEGISHFTIFNDKRQPVCERLYFKQPEERLELRIKADQPEYAIRKKVNIELSALNKDMALERADMSISVFLVDSLQLSDQNDIFSYLWLSSDLKGAIESPGYYLHNIGPETDEAVDNLMLTHGWRRFRWEDILETKSNFEFLPEYEGHIINGKLTDKRNATPVQNVFAFLSVSGERFHFNNTVSKENGSLRFIVKNFYGPGELIIQTKDTNRNFYRIDISSPFFEKFSSTVVPAFDLDQKWKSELNIRSISSQVQNAYLMEKRQQLYWLKPDDTLSFYGKPDKIYNLDDYTRFITMEEVMREYVPEVRVRKYNGNFHYQVLDLPYKSYFENDPLVLLDGVPVFDINKIVGFDPLKIKKMEIVSRQHYFGELISNGIVSYSTYEGDLGGFELDPDALVIQYEGLQLKREFYSPVYESSQQIQSRIPDYRNVLYWSPDIKTGRDGKAQLSFYTSDLPGTYAVVVQGITSKGEAGSAAMIISVKK